MEILLKMPEEITDEPTTEWRCTGHVVRVERVDRSQKKLGIGVQFDCYEVSRDGAAERRAAEERTVEAIGADHTRNGNEI